jgi:serine/threonine protein kinase HipA of HipAB toxin-antitoxin module
MFNCLLFGQRLLRNNLESIRVDVDCNLFLEEVTHRSTEGHFAEQLFAAVADFVGNGGAAAFSNLAKHLGRNSVARSCE